MTRAGNRFPQPVGICDMGDELTAGGMLHCGRDTDLHPELIQLVRLAFADALHLGRVQRIDLAAALAAILRQYPLGEMERLLRTRH